MVPALPSSGRLTPDFLTYSILRGVGRFAALFGQPARDRQHWRIEWVISGSETDRKAAQVVRCLPLPAEARFALSRRSLQSR